MGCPIEILLLAGVGLTAVPLKSAELVQRVLDEEEKG